MTYNYFAILLVLPGFLLPEAVAAPSLPVFEASLDGAWSNMV